MTAMDCKVYVGDLGYGAAKQELEDVFSKYGPLRNVWVARNPPGFAFVEFEDPRDAEDAVRALDGSRLNGRRVRVEMSTGRSRRGGRRPLPSSGPRYGSNYGRDNSSRYRRRSRSYSPRGRGRSSRSYSRSRSRSGSRDRRRSASRERRDRSASQEGSLDRFGRDLSRKVKSKSRSKSPTIKGSKTKSRSRSTDLNKSGSRGRSRSRSRSIDKSKRDSLDREANVKGKTNGEKTDSRHEKKASVTSNVSEDETHRQANGEGDNY